jgi:hypothetical protein
VACKNISSLHIKFIPFTKYNVLVVLFHRIVHGKYIFSLGENEMLEEWLRGVWKNVSIVKILNGLV